jgi:hypothetical protein
MYILYATHASPGSEVGVPMTRGAMCIEPSGGHLPAPSPAAAALSVGGDDSLAGHSVRPEAP